VTGIQDPSWASAVRLYPNPVRSSLQVDWPEQLEDPVVQIFSPAGGQIRQLAPNRSPAVISVRDLPAGLYWLTIRSGRTRLSRSFAVIR
jgi:hypothetical protein